MADDEENASPPPPSPSSSTVDEFTSQQRIIVHSPPLTPPSASTDDIFRVQVYSEQVRSSREGQHTSQLSRFVLPGAPTTSGGSGHFLPSEAPSSSIGGQSAFQQSLYVPSEAPSSSGGVPSAFQQSVYVLSEAPSSSGGGQSTFYQSQIVPSEAPSSSGGGQSMIQQSQPVPSVSRRSSGGLASMVQQFRPPQPPPTIVQAHREGIGFPVWVQLYEASWQYVSHTVIEVVYDEEDRRRTQIDLRRWEEAYYVECSFQVTMESQRSFLWCALLRSFDEQVIEPDSELQIYPTLPIETPPFEDGYKWKMFDWKRNEKMHIARYQCAVPNCRVIRIVDRSLETQRSIISYQGRHEHPRPSAAAGPSNPQHLHNLTSAPTSQHPFSSHH